jgi:hypothetical protein
MAGSWGGWVRQHVVLPHLMVANRLEPLDGAPCAWQMRLAPADKCTHPSVVTQPSQSNAEMREHEDAVVGAMEGVMVLDDDDTGLFADDVMVLVVVVLVVVVVAAAAVVCASGKIDAVVDAVVVAVVVVASVVLTDVVDGEMQNCKSDLN